MSSNILPRKPLPKSSFVTEIRSNDRNQKDKLEATRNNPHAAISTVSKWGTGWRTPTKVGVFYISSLCLAIVHLCMILYLKGKPAEGPNRAANQSYVSTASNVLSNAFTFCLRAALVIVYTQYLWHLLRVEYFKVSTIEKLYSLQNNPLLLLDFGVFKSATGLFALSLIMATTSIAVSFTPGALTVTSSTRVSVDTMSVPTFNASFMGNGSSYDAQVTTLDNLSSFNDSFVLPASMLGLYSTSLRSIATQTLIAGDYTAQPSPCGANCSYSITVDAPYMECNESSPTILYNLSESIPTMYEGIWQSPLEIAVGLTNEDFSSLNNFTGILNTSILSLKGLDYGNDANGTILITENNNLLCSPSRATYTLNVTYESNVERVEIVNMSVEKMVNLLLSATPKSIGSMNFPEWFNTSITTPLNWTTDQIAWYRDLNIMAIADAMAIALSGRYGAYPERESDDNTTFPDYGNTLWSTNLTWLDYVTNPSVPPNSPYAGSFLGYEFQGGANETIIGNTRFSSNYDQYNLPLHAGGFDINFNITQDLLNEALLNITLSAIPAYGRWNTSTNVTISSNLNIYTFSKPVNFFIPYALNLLLGLLSVVLGAFILRSNGVSAIDGSFIQLMVTSAGSRKLHDAAVGGCLGGFENTPEELNELRIKFGELKGSEIEAVDGRVVRRAGFGTRDEVLPLVKNEIYGKVRAEKVERSQVTGYNLGI